MLLKSVHAPYVFIFYIIYIRQLDNKFQVCIWYESRKYIHYETMLPDVITKKNAHTYSIS